MPREHEDYRELLARLDAKFPDRELLTNEDLRAYTGRQYKWVRNHFGVTRTAPITKAKAARLLCQIGV